MTGSWNLSSSVGGCAGVALTSIVFLVTQDMTPTMTAMVVAGGVTALVLGILVARQAAENWSTLWFFVSLGVSIPLVYKAFKSFQPKPLPPLAQVELPGFSIKLPELERDRFSTEYNFGWVDTRDPKRELWTSVLWSSGTLSDVDTPEQAQEWMRIFDFNNPITVRDRLELEWPGLDARTYRLFLELQSTVTTYVACGARLIAVMTWGNWNDRDQVDPMHRRIVSTVVCSPDPKEEASVGRPPPVNTTVPEGWRSMPEVAPLRTVWGNGNAMLMFQYFHRGHPSLSDVKVMVTDSIGTWGTVELKSSERVGEIELWRGTLTDEEGEQALYARKMMCGERPMIALLFGFETVEEGRAALLAARCEL